MCQKGPLEERYTLQNLKTVEDLCVRNSPVKRHITEFKNNWGLVFQKQPCEERYSLQNLKTVEGLCVRKGPMKRGTHYRILKQLKTCVSETLTWREVHISFSPKCSTQLHLSWVTIKVKVSLHDRSSLNSQQSRKDKSLKPNFIK